MAGVTAAGCDWLVRSPGNRDSSLAPVQAVSRCHHKLAAKYRLDTLHTRFRQPSDYIINYTRVWGGRWPKPQQTEHQYEAHINRGQGGTE